MLDHHPEPGHPESPDRLAGILRHLDTNGLAARGEAGVVREATREELLRVHTPVHLAEVEAVEIAGGGRIEIDTWMSKGSGLAARLAAGAAVDAVAGVIEGKAPRALCLVRPPGHHARPEGPMGFCLYNSIAVAAMAAIEAHALNRVLIIDWDVHHGNGTQDAFYEDPRVAFVSLHRWPFYPGTGGPDEHGSGRGLGFTKNVPLRIGISREHYISAFRYALEGMADHARPELVLISAGFDAHRADPIGSLGLEVEDFETLTREVLDVASVHAGGRVVSLLEGGYNVPILARCVATHLETLLGSSSKQ
jgi:acetoin utilization deacetylase AcuC-like enzyme